MATYSKRLFLTLLYKTNRNNALLASGNNFRFHLSVVHCSVPSETTRKGLSKAMKAYLEKNKKYNKFLVEQLKEYDLGKKFLASMMGKKSEMSQKDIDDAIEYLFPSGLFVPRARPLMKHPEEIFAKTKEAQFDYSGRPFHFLFYTSKPNFSQYLHEAATHLEKLNDYEAKMKKTGQEVPDKSLVLTGSWMAQEKLEMKCLEKLHSTDYSKFIEVFDRLAEHPYAYIVEDFIKEFWVSAVIQQDSEIPLPEVQEDGSKVMTSHLAQRKTSLADVKLKYPGTGQIKINNLGLDYFFNIQSREQVIFPLVFTGMEKSIDVEATVEHGGESSQAGAVRLGISRALQSFVTPEMRLRMKVAGLLHRDVRRKERKKPGQEGARRRYTWLKR